MIQDLETKHARKLSVPSIASVEPLQNLNSAIFLKSQKIWLDPAKPIGSYDLSYNELVEFKKPVRALKVKTLDSAVKTIMIDDSKPVKESMEIICSKFGNYN